MSDTTQASSAAPVDDAHTSDKAIVFAALTAAGIHRVTSSDDFREASRPFTRSAGRNFVENDVRVDEVDERRREPEQRGAGGSLYRACGPPLRRR
jgi:hypothetical protein